MRITMRDCRGSATPRPRWEGLRSPARRAPRRPICAKAMGRYSRWMRMEITEGRNSDSAIFRTFSAAARAEGPMKDTLSLPMARMWEDAAAFRARPEHWPAEPQRTTCKQERASVCAWSQLHRYDSSGCDSLEQWAEWTEHRSH